jgi:hypothetical protein
MGANEMLSTSNATPGIMSSILLASVACHLGLRSPLPSVTRTPPHTAPVPSNSRHACRIVVSSRVVYDE